MFISAECELRGPKLTNDSWTSFCHENNQAYTTDSKTKIHCKLGYAITVDETSKDVKCGVDGWEDVPDCYRGVSTFR